MVSNTAAASAGIQPGNVIIAIDGTAINGYPDIDTFVAASSGRPLAIDIERNGTRVRVRASPRLALVPTRRSSVRQRRVLGISPTEFSPHHGSDPIPMDPGIINPIVPDPPPPNLPMITPN